MDQAPPKKMTPGDDMHLTLLMAPHNLNLVTGQDRQHLLAFGRAAFEAGKAAAAAQQGVQPVATRYRFIINGKTLEWRPGDVEMMDNPHLLIAQKRGEIEMQPLYTHPTTQGLDARVRVGTLWIEESGANDIELSPFSLPKLSPGEYALFTLAAQDKQAEALQASRSGGCGCCSNACADRLDGCRFVHESPGAADMAAAQAKQGGM